MPVTSSAGYMGRVFDPFIPGKDDIVLSQNSGSSNRLGDLKIWDASLDNYRIYTPAQDTVISSTGKRAVRVNQGNCTGLIITNGSYKTLVLYSVDGNPVSQQIELGAVYVSADGKSYSFSGTKSTCPLQIMPSSD